MAKKFEIRNSTAEFLTFIIEGKEEGIQVVYKDDTIWATQKAMATLFDVGVPAISKLLKNIFESGELDKATTISKMETIVNRDFRGLSCQFYPGHSIPAMVYICALPVRYPGICHRQETNGDYLNALMQ